MIRPWRGGSPADDQLLVRVEACVAGGAELRALQDPGRVAPGGAAVGTVEAAGANAAELAGARVIVGPIDPCGECDVCRRGQTSVCPKRAVRGVTTHGALCTHVLAAARWVCRVDGDLAVPGPEAALLGREASVAYAMYVRLGVAPGDAVAVVGDGAIGALVRQIAAARGARLVDLADAGAPAVHVFETTGAMAGRARAISSLGPAARLALVAPSVTGAAAIDALPAKRIVDIPPNRSKGGKPPGATIVTIAGAHPDLIPELAAMAIKGEVDLAAAAQVIAPPALDDLEAHIHRGEREGTVPVVAIGA